MQAFTYVLTRCAAFVCRWTWVMEISGDKIWLNEEPRLMSNLQWTINLEIHFVQHFWSELRRVLLYNLKGHYKEVDNIPQALHSTGNSQYLLLHCGQKYPLVLNPWPVLWSKWLKWELSTTLKYCQINYHLYVVWMFSALSMVWCILNCTIRQNIITC